MVADNPQQFQRAKALGVAVRAKVAELAALRAEDVTGGETAARVRLVEGGGQQLMSDVRAIGATEVYFHSSWRVVGKPCSVKRASASRRSGRSADGPFPARACSIAAK